MRPEERIDRLYTVTMLDSVGTQGGGLAHLDRPKEWIHRETIPWIDCDLTDISILQLNGSSPLLSSGC